MVKKLADKNIDLKVSDHKIIRKPRTGGSGEVVEQSDNKCPHGKHKYDHKKEKHCHKCKKPTAINSVPYVIDKPGKYCVTKDLVYEGDSIAISIQSVTNVELDFDNKNLYLTNPDAIAISITQSSEVTIQNDAIALITVPTVDSIGVGISITDSDKIDLLGLSIVDFPLGVVALSSSEISLVKVRIENSLQSNLTATLVTSLKLNQVFFTNETVPLTAGNVLTRVDEISFNNSDFVNSDIFYVQGNNGILDKLRMEITDVNYIFGVIQLGAGVTEARTGIVNNVIVKDSVLINKSNVGLGSACLFLVAGKGHIFERNSFSLDPVLPYQSDTPQTAVIAIGSSDDPRVNSLIGGIVGLPIQDIIIRNCVISGPATYGIVLASPEDVVNSLNGRITIADNVISNATDALIIALNFNISVIKGNDIAQVENFGILIDGSSRGNSILNNNIRFFDNIGILLGLDTTANLIKENNVFAGAQNIVDNGSNVQVSNTAF